MTTTRLEAFSDGVIAIVVTIMVLELRAPSQPTVAALYKVAPSLISYALSFLVVAIMWVNHHHLIHAVHKVTAGLLWANLYLLFWMSLVPFVTDYLGKNHREPLAVALYGLDLTLCSSAFIVLREVLIRQDRHDSAMAEYHASIQRKNLLSAGLYLLSAPLAYASIYASFFIFIQIPVKYFLSGKAPGGRLGVIPFSHAMIHGTSIPSPPYPTNMRARLAKIPARVWGLIALPVVVWAGPITAIVGPMIIRALVPETVRVVLSLL